MPSIPVDRVEENTDATGPDEGYWLLIWQFTGKGSFEDLFQTLVEEAFRRIAKESDPADGVTQRCCAAVEG